MEIKIYDIDNELINVCKEKFKNTDVKCEYTYFQDLKADYIVTAGNCYGVMTGGIDLAVRECLGQYIQDRLQDTIMMDLNGRLEIGDIVVIPIDNNDKKKYLIYAPTMLKPKRIQRETIYLVACSIFRFAKSYMAQDKSLAICGLGTKTGEVSNEDFAEMIYRAYIDIIGEDK